VGVVLGFSKARSMRTYVMLCLIALLLDHSFIRSFIQSHPCAAFIVLLSIWPQRQTEWAHSDDGCVCVCGSME